jgi:hypothetical protein
MSAVRFATLLFFAFASFCLGSIALSTGGANLLARTFQAQDVLTNGVFTPPTEPWQSILIVATYTVTLLFVILAVYFGVKDLEGPPPEE